MAGRVVIGINNTSPSRAALRWAAGYAASARLPLVINHIVDARRSTEGSAARIDDSDSGSELLQSAVDLIADSHGDLDVSIELGVGMPAQQLAELSRPDDLLVIGTHKTGFLRGRVLGSNGIAIAAACACSVVVIPEDHLPNRSGVVTSVTSGHAALEAAAAEARRFDETLTLVAADERDDHEGDLLSALHRAAATLTDVAVRNRLARSGEVDALLDASRSARLLVLEEPHDASFLGSVAHDVLLNINCPVLIVRS